MRGFLGSPWGAHGDAELLQSLFVPALSLFEHLAATHVKKARDAISSSPPRLQTTGVTPFPSRPLHLVPRGISVPSKASSTTRTHSAKPRAATHHPHGPAGAQAVAAAVPAMEVGVLAVLQHVLLPLEVGVSEADPSPAPDTDGVDPAEEPPVLEAAAGPTDVQPPARETFPFVEGDLGWGRRRARW